MTGYVSVKQVAQIAGVHPSTVSRALNGHLSLPQSTRERILAIARNLGYRINPTLSRIARSRWSDHALDTIAYIGRKRVEGQGGSFDTHWDAILNRAKERNFKVELFLMDEKTHLADLDPTLYARGIEGLIIGPLNPYHSLEFNWSNYTAINLLPNVHRPRLHAVQNNHFEAIVLAWETMVNYGYRRIGAILMHHETPIRDDDLRYGALSACQRKIFPHLRPIQFIESKPVRTPGYINAVATWIRTNRLDAVLSFSSGEYYFLKDCGALNGVGYASMHARGLLGLESPVAGVSVSDAEAGAEAINILELCLRSYQRGLPARPIVHLVSPVWYDAASLPKKCS